MLNWIKKQSIAAWIILGAAIFALIGLIIYSVLAIVLLAGIIAANGKVPQWVISAAMVVVVVFLALSIGDFIYNRTDVAGNQWFIPDLDTPEQGACLNQAITGVVFYFLSVVAVIVAAVMGKFSKENA